MKDNMKERTSASGRIAGVIIAIFIVLLAAVMPAAVSRLIPACKDTFLGWRPLVMRTNTMEGKIRKNAVMIVFAAKWAALDVGDIITFELPDGRFETHRVIAKDGAHIATKGDNAPAADMGWVTSDNYKYKVMIIMNWAAWLNEHRTAACLICLPALLAALACGGVILARRIKLRRQRLKNQTQPGAAPPEDTAGRDCDCELWVDEMLMLLDPLAMPPTRTEKKAAEDEETPHEEPEQEIIVENDNGSCDLDWDDWAFSQLRQQPAPPGDADAAIGGGDRAGTPPGAGTEHGQPVPPPGKQRAL